MKSVPRVVLCTAGVLSVFCFLFISMPMEREGEFYLVINFELNPCNLTLIKIKFVDWWNILIWHYIYNILRSLFTSHHSSLEIYVLLYYSDTVIGWTYNTTRNTSQYISADNVTANLMPEHLCDQKVFLFMIVCSAPGNFDARSAIRKTWGQKQIVHGQEVSAYFLIGETMNATMQVRIKSI